MHYPGKFGKIRTFDMRHGTYSKKIDRTGRLRRVYSVGSRWVKKDVHQHHSYIHYVQCYNFLGSSEKQGNDALGQNDDEKYDRK